jgi:hypothetical protein
MQTLIAYDSSLNYRFLFHCYVGLTLLSIFLAVLQFCFDVSSVTGFWIVPAPTVLCLPFLAWRWRQQSALESGSSSSSSSSSSVESSGSSSSEAGKAGAETKKGR